jgi:hypothetical protein
VAISTEVVSAVIGAVTGGGVSLIIHQQDASRQRVQELRETLLKLLDLREQFGDPNVNAALLNQRRSMLLAVADSLASRSRRALSSPDWLALGVESEADRDFVSARGYYARGLKVARKSDAMTQVYALRTVAAYHYSGAPDADPAVGTMLFDEAASLTSASEDTYLRFTTGYTFASWAWCARAAGDERWQQLGHQALLAFDACGADYTIAVDEAARLRRWMRDPTPARSDGPPPPAREPTRGAPNAEP